MGGYDEDAELLEICTRTREFVQVGLFFFLIFGPHVIEDNIMMARTWNLLDQSSYPLLLECQKRGVLQQGGLGKATREKSEAMCPIRIST